MFKTLLQLTPMSLTTLLHGAAHLKIQLWRESVQTVSGQWSVRMKRLWPIGQIRWWQLRGKPRKNTRWKSFIKEGQQNIHGN